jgi:hypothetical protein
LFDKLRSVEAGLTLSKLVSPQDALRQKLEAGSRMPDELRVSRASIDTPQDALRQSIDNLKRKRYFKKWKICRCIS